MSYPWFPTEVCLGKFVQRDKVALYESVLDVRNSGTVSFPGTYRSVVAKWNMEGVE